MYRPKSTLEQWRIFQAVVDFGGYAQASDHLNKSQSSLNHAVAKLQQQLGVQLLEVRGRKAFLTEEGEVLLRRSRQLTQHIEELEHLADTLDQGWEPEIVLAVDLIHPRNLVYDALDQFCPECRSSRIQIVDSVLTGTIEMIIEKKAHLAITATVPKGFLGDPLLVVDLLPICHPGHSLARLDHPISGDELAQYRQIVIRDTSQSPSETAGWLKAEQRWTVSNFFEALALVERNIGFCWMPSHMISRHLEQGRLKVIDMLQGKVRRLQSYLVQPAPESLGPGARKLAELLLSLHQNNAPG